MREAIFLAVTRHSKFEARVAQLRGTAGRAFVERLFLRAGLLFETFSPSGDFVAMTSLLDRCRAKKEEIVG